MSLRTRKSLGLIASALLLSLGAGTSAQATMMQITINSTVTVDDYGLLGIGNPLSVDFFVDDLTADENGTPGIFAATTPGTFSTMVSGLPVAGNILDLGAAAGLGSWLLNAESDLQPAGRWSRFWRMRSGYRSQPRTPLPE